MEIVIDQGLIRLRRKNPPPRRLRWQTVGFRRRALVESGHPKLDLSQKRLAPFALVPLFCVRRWSSWDDIDPGWGRR